MGSLTMRDCIVLPYKNFKERIRVTEDLKREMKKNHPRKKYDLFILDGCVMVEFRSNKQFH